MTPRTRDESGASLIFVIVFVTLFAVIAAALISFANTGFKVTEAVDDVRVQQLGADGAMQGAINALRGSRIAGKWDATATNHACLLPTTAKPERSFKYVDADGQIYRVMCTSVDPSALPEYTTFKSIPDHTLLALGTGTVSQDQCEGITVESNGNEQLAIGGHDIYSNSRIAVGFVNRPITNCSPNLSGSPYLSVQGDINAKRECDPVNPYSMEATGEIKCLTGVDTADPKYPATQAWGTDTLPSFANAINQYVRQFAGSSSLTTDQVVDRKAVCANNNVVKWLPGLYTEKLKSAYYLTNLAAGGCASATTWWFSPGTYYFDFQDPCAVASPANNCDNATLWDLLGDDVNLVAGSPTGGSPTSAPSVVPFGSGACQKDADYGVQFIFGGSTRIHAVKDSGKVGGAFEICSGAAARTGDQKIAFYGYPTGTRGDPNTATHELAPTNPVFDFASPSSSCPVGTTKVTIGQHVLCDRGDPSPVTAANWTVSGTGTLAGAVKNDDGANNPYAQVALASNGVKTASFDLSGIHVPEGSTVKSVMLKVRHLESVTQTSKGGAVHVVPSLTATVQATTGTRTCKVPSNLISESSTYQTKSIELVGLASNENGVGNCFGTSFTYSDVNKLKLTWAVDGSSLTTTTIKGTCTGRNCTPPPDTFTYDTATAKLDQLAVVVTYLPPGFEASKCPTSAKCAIFDAEAASGSTRPIVEVHGTIYAPLSKVRIEVRGTTGKSASEGTTTFDRGIIARYISLKVSKGSHLSDSPFTLPAESKPSLRYVRFEVVKCGTSDCTPTDTSKPPAARALVLYRDTAITGYQVFVKSWVNLRCTNATEVSGRCRHL